MAKRALQHDPEYEAIPAEIQEKRIKLIEDNVREQSKKKIESIIKSNFLQEVSSKSSEIDSLEETLQECRATCDRLRACAITKYYATINQDSKAPSSVPSVHPTVKKYLGKHPRGVETDVDSSSPTKAPSESFERISTVPSTPIPIKQEITNPQYLSPSKDISTRAPRFKTKCKIIVGNISSFIPSWKRDESDQSQYKWMVYVRGDKQCPNIESFVSRVVFLLHQSYRPNDIVEVCNPPFQLVKRGWGEFLMRVQLHFHDTRNKPVDIHHFLKLDKTCTGLQTMGAETVADLQLFKPVVSPLPQSLNTLATIPEPVDQLESSEPVEQSESSEPPTVEPEPDRSDIKLEPAIDPDDLVSVPNNSSSEPTEKLTNIVENNATEVSTDGTAKKAPVPNGVNKAYLKCTDAEGRVLLVPQASLLRIQPQQQVKKVDKTKVPSYFLKVVPNSGKNQVLLIPMGGEKRPKENGEPPQKEEPKSSCWDEDLSSIRIDYYKSFPELLKRVCRAFPIVKNDLDKNVHPYCASTLEEFLRWNIGKQRAAEWRRSGLMRTALVDLLRKHESKYLGAESVWSRAKIMTWCRKNGFVPMNSEKMTQLPEPKWSGVELCSLTNAEDIVSALKDYSKSDCEDDIDILSTCNEKPPVPKLTPNQQTHLSLPPSDEACTYVREIASQVGVKLKPLEVEPSTFAPVVEELILSACRQLATDLMRASVNEGYKRMGGQLCPEEITVSDVYSAVKETPEFDFLSNRHLGVPKGET